MNENIDLTEILKDCPKGTEFYSCIYGKVRFDCLQYCEYPVLIMRGDGLYASFSRVGKYTDAPDSECCLFPSREQRDWSKFSAPWYKKLVEPKFKVGDKIVNSLRKYMGAMGPQGVISEITDNKYIFTDSSYIYISNQYSWELASNKKPKFDSKTLKPFEKVLVRDECYESWKCDFFSHINDNSVFRYITTNSSYKHCIPYSDDTKHLVGTADEAPEYYRYWED